MTAQILFLMQRQSFDTAMQPMKVKPVPEVGVYGAVLVGVCLLCIFIAKQTRR